ncbi:MAG TPA: glycosyltransferase family 4 protein, partial [Candidatus Saccharibacteria bacterium]|nr:glycosyltransferase family 4 protein [Candidatus Saccharibacteria bacterium]
MKYMKIGIVCPYNMFQFAGGVQDIVVNLHTYLSAQGHSVKIITPRPRAHQDSVSDHYILVGRSAKMNTPFNTMADIGFEADGDEIQAILDREQFDIIHFHEPWVPVLSRQILSRSKSINVATFHAKLPESLLSKSIISTVVPYTKSILKYIDTYTAVSPAAAEHLQSLSDEHVEIIPNGIRLEQFTHTNHLTRKNKKKRIVYLGRLEKRKGIEHLLSAYASLRESHKDVELIIGGNGVKNNMLQRIVAQYEIPDVTFLGYVTEEDKPYLLASADVFCSPALYGESFGIVLLEAMAVGTPVVAGNNSGYASVMTGKGRL